MLKTFLMLIEERLWFITALIHLTVAITTTFLYLITAVSIRWFNKL